MTKTTVYVLRLCMLLLFIETVATQSVMAQAQQEKKISLKEALEAVEKRFGTKFAYEHNLLEGKTTTTKALEGETAAEVLKNILYPNNLIFLYVSNNAYSIVSRSASFFNNNQPATPAQRAEQAVANAGQATGRYTVRGTVSDLNGNALPFVDIWVKGTNNGTQTVDKGDFILANVGGADTIVFTYVGYVTERIGVDGRYTLNIMMQPDGKSSLSEVVVVSTGLQKLPKERATGSFATISSKELEKIPVPNVIQRLEGLIPGVKIDVKAGDRSFIYGGGSGGNQRAINSATRTTGANDYDMAIRGRGTLIGERFPLVVVDGAISEMDLSAFNPTDIDNITFLKDAAAASIWGVRAANGVIVITTKKGRSNQVPNISFSAGFMISGKPDLGYIRTMNSAQMIDYEAELVNRNIMTTSVNLSPLSYYYTYYPNTGAALALKLKAGVISQAAYNTSVDSLKAIDNRSQVSDYLLQSARNQQYNLSISGGNNYSSYFYSASYSKEDPNVKRTQGQRLTLTLNNSWKLFKIATLTTSLKGSFFNYANNGLALTSLYRASSTTLLPYQQLVDNNGKSVGYYRGNPDFFKSLVATGRPDWKYNYLDELNLGDNVQKDNNYVANIQLSAPIYKGLSASVMYTNERTFSSGRVYYDPATYTMRDMINRYTAPTATSNSLNFTGSSGGLSISNTTLNNYALRGQLSYDNTIKRIHQLNVIAGSEIRQTQIGYGNYTLWGYNVATGIAPQLTYNNFSSYQAVTGGTTAFNEGGYPSQADKRRRFLSYFSNAAYTLMGKYSLSGSVRYDDYNNYGLDVKFRATPLWSAGAKWDIHKEAFMKKNIWLSTLSLRATYGVTGNIASDLYPYTYIAAGSSDYPTGLPYTGVINLANPQLKWEKTYVTNIGVDFGVLDNKLAGSVEYYRRSGKDLLYALPINAAYAGTVNSGLLTRNISAMTNKGVDVSLRAQVYSNKDWTVSLGATLSYNTNKITDGRIDSTRITTSTISYYAGTMGNLSGYSTDKLLVYRHAGLSATGLTRVYNSKGDTVAINQSVYMKDLKYAGRTTAPYFGSFNTTVRYKRFSFYALLTYQFGNVFLKPSIYSYMYRSTALSYDVSADIAKRWKKPGDEATTNVPGLNGNITYVNYSVGRYQYSDINVLPADYVRLREVALSYQFPASFFRGFVKGASFTATVRNLGLLWRANKEGYDPDFVSYAGTTYGLPAAKSYNFSLNVNF